MEDGPECDAVLNSPAEDRDGDSQVNGESAVSSSSCSGSGAAGGKRLTSGPFEDADQGSKKRLKWLAHLEFASSGQDSGSNVASSSSGNGGPSSSARSGAGGGKGETLAWDSMIEGITRTEKLR